MLVTVSDRFGMQETGTADDIPDAYLPVVRSAHNYYAFGMIQPSGNNVSGYRFGFNGKEKDSEWGGGAMYDYGFRIYDPRIARFLSVDPLAPDFPWYTPYQFAGNKPIVALDLDGLEEYSIHSKYLSELLYQMVLEKKSDAEIYSTVLRWARKKNKFETEEQKQDAIKHYGYQDGKPIVELVDPSGPFRVMGWVWTNKGVQSFGVVNPKNTFINAEADFSDKPTPLPIGPGYHPADMTFEQGVPYMITGASLVFGAAGLGWSIVTNAGRIALFLDVASIIGDIDDLTADKKGVTLLEKTVGQNTVTLVKLTVDVTDITRKAWNIPDVIKNGDQAEISFEVVGSIKGLSDIGDNGSKLLINLSHDQIEYKKAASVSQSNE